MRLYWLIATLSASSISPSAAFSDYTSMSEEKLGAIVRSCVDAIEVASHGSFVDITEYDVDDLDTTRTLYPDAAYMMFIDIPRRGVQKNAVEKLKERGDQRALTFVFHREVDSFVGMVEWVKVYLCHLKDGNVQGVHDIKSIHLKR